MEPTERSFTAFGGYVSRIGRVLSSTDSDFCLEELRADALRNERMKGRKWRLKLMSAGNTRIRQIGDVLRTAMRAFTDLSI